MTKLLLHLCIYFFIVAPVVCYAENLIFPMNESEIVNALQFKDKQMNIDGVVYESKDGRIFKIINGNRYRIRGLKLTGLENIVPRVGALIYFDIDSSTILQDSYSLLDEYGKAMTNGLREFVVVVAGHTDNTGSLEYNRKLSEKRAIAVKDYLIKNFDINPNQIIAKGYGEIKPIAENDTNEGRNKNRRVEFLRIE